MGQIEHSPGRAEEVSDRALPAGTSDESVGEESKGAVVQSPPPPCKWTKTGHIMAVISAVVGLVGAGLALHIYWENKRMLADPDRLAHAAIIDASAMLTRISQELAGIEVPLRDVMDPVDPFAQAREQEASWARSVLGGEHPENAMIIQSFERSYSDRIEETAAKKARGDVTRALRDIEEILAELGTISSRVSGLNQLSRRRAVLMLKEAEWAEKMERLLRFSPTRHAALIASHEAMSAEDASRGLRAEFARFHPTGRTFSLDPSSSVNQGAGGATPDMLGKLDQAIHRYDSLLASAELRNALAAVAGMGVIEASILRARERVPGMRDRLDELRVTGWLGAVRPLSMLEGRVNALVTSLRDSESELAKAGLSHGDTGGLLARVSNLERQAEELEADLGDSVRVLRGMAERAERWKASTAEWAQRYPGAWSLLRERSGGEHAKIIASSTVTPAADSGLQEAVRAWMAANQSLDELTVSIEVRLPTLDRYLNVDEDGRTGIHTLVLAKDAARLGGLLVDLGDEMDAALCVRDNAGYTPLMLAITHQTGRDIVALLVRSNADPGERHAPSGGRNALHMAAAAADSFALEEILRHATKPFDVDARTLDTHQTPIMIAVARGSEACVDALLSGGRRVDLNQRTGLGFTLMHLAAARGNLGVIQRLYRDAPLLLLESCNNLRPVDVAPAGADHVVDWLNRHTPSPASSR